MEERKRKKEFERQRWKADNRKWEAEMELKKQELARQSAKDAAEQERKDSSVMKKKLFGDAMRGSAIRMGADPIDVVPFFRNVEQLFKVYDVPAELQAMLLSPFLNDRAKSILGRLSPEVLGDYERHKAAFLQEFKLSANVYLKRFNKCCKTKDETYVAFASKLKSLLDYYLESRDVKDFAHLCELLVCDRIKSVLSKGCLKYVLSIKSASKPGWLAMRDLTEAIDRYTAAHSVTDKPISFAVGQTPIKSSDSATVLPHTGPNTLASKVTSSAAGRGRGRGVCLMNDNRRCHHCGVLGHIRPMCPELRGKSKTPAAGVKRVSIGARPRHGIGEQGADEMQAVASIGPCEAEDQTGVNLSALLTLMVLPA